MIGKPIYQHPRAKKILVDKQTSTGNYRNTGIVCDANCV